jgi:hypothetical protein
MKRLFAAAIAASCLVLSTPALAGGDDPGAVDKWLDSDAPECVPMSAIRAVSTVRDLTPDQFQFVRALYVAIPPVSRKLPPDRAVMASSGGAVMVALVADGQACARFLAPDFIQAMVVEVGQGMTVSLGTPL